MNDPAPIKIWNDYDGPHRDLREFLSRIERAGELLRVPGAHWNLEMGTLAESVNERPDAPAVLFEDVPEYPRGFRVLSGSTNSMRRLAITLGFPVPAHPLDVVRAYRDRMKAHRPIPPRIVRDGPILENILPEEKLDVLKFPVPFLHELDGGRYIGTDDLVIMRDPEENWINCGTYRVMVHDAKRVGVWMSPGKHGRQIREKYFKQGKPCPVLVSCGHDPMLFLAGGNELRFGLSEYDYAGGHRDDPILTMATPMRPPSDFSYSKCVMKAGMIWDEVERAGLSGVKGVWCHEAGGARMFNVIAIKQAYAGHAKQAAMAAASCQSGSYLGRFVVVVDEDIDPTNLFDVLWAMCTRCDPAEDIDIVRKMWSGPLDPRIPRGTTWNSRAVIDACRPFKMLKDFPPVARASPDLRRTTEAKFRDILSKL